MLSDLNQRITMSPLPFNFRDSLSSEEIKRKFKNIISSSDSYNNYFNKVYKYKKQYPAEKDEEAVETATKLPLIQAGISEMDKKYISLNMRSNFFPTQNSNQDYFDIKYENRKLIKTRNSNNFKPYPTNSTQYSSMFMIAEDPVLNVMKKKGYNEISYLFELFYKDSELNTLSKLIFLETPKPNPNFIFKNEFDSETGEMNKYIKNDHMNFRSGFITFTSDKISHCINIPFCILHIFYIYNRNDVIKILSLCLIFEFKECLSVIFDRKKYLLMVNDQHYEESDKFEYFKENFKFTWLTKNRIFEVTVNMPSVELTIKKNSLKFKKTLTKEIIFHIIEKDFINWEFILLNYLILSKQFRQILSNNYSKRADYTFAESRRKKEINLDSAHKSTCKSSSIDDIVYSFVYIDDKNKSFNVKIHGYVADYSSKKSFDVDMTYTFTLGQSMMLFKVSAKQLLDDYVYELFCRPQNKLELNNKLYDNFNNRNEVKMTHSQSMKNIYTKMTKECGYITVK